MLEELDFCVQAMQNAPFLAGRCVLALNIQKIANPALTHPTVATSSSNTFLVKSVTTWADKQGKVP